MRTRNILSFLIGAGIGSALTWLFTSKKGKEIRDSIKEEAEKRIRKFPKNESTQHS